MMKNYMKNWKFVFSNDDLFHDRKIHFKLYIEFNKHESTTSKIGDGLNMTEIEEWCEEHFDEKFLVTPWDLLCDSEEDAFAFKMRWL
jgi:hypothetical protein